MQFQDAPRAAIRVWLGAARLPLRAAEAVVRRDGEDEGWPPVLAFESFESQVKQFAGSLLRDEDLVEEGRVIAARVGQLRRAAELETLAERREAAAAARFEARRENARERRHRIEREAEARERAIERVATAKKHDVERDAQRKKEQAAQAGAATRKAAARRARAAASTRAAGERAAVRKQRVAVGAKGRVVAADRKLRATKAARKANR
jgi:hypothetical protein